MPVLLALDSATDCLALSLTVQGEQHLFEAAGGAQASAQIVPQTMALLAKAGLALQDVDAIGFGRGPGAFTGLRTACAVAQGLAFGVGKPVLALDSLMLVAEDARAQAGAGGAPLLDPLWVVMDARMNEIYAAQYEFMDSAWRCLKEPALYAPAALRERMAGAPAAAGNALEVFAALLPEPARAWPRQASRASALARLAEQAWNAGALLDAAEAQPLYVRDKVAFTTAERLQAGGLR